MTHTAHNPTAATVKALLLTLCLCALLLPTLGAAQSPQGQLEPIGQPVPVETTDADNAGDRQLQERHQGLDQSVSREIQSALESAGIKSNGTAVGLALLIPILGVIFIFGGPVAVIIIIAALHYRSKARKTQIQADCALRALEAGQEIPTELWNADGMDSPERSLRKGLKNIGLGTGLLLALTILIGFEVGALGFILIGIGAAQLLIWKLDTGKTKDPA